MIYGFRSLSKRAQNQIAVEFLRTLTNKEESSQKKKRGFFRFFSFGVTHEERRRKT